MPKAPEAFLYTIAHGAESYIIRKWDKLAFDCLSEYIMPLAYDDAGDQSIGCTCPQGLKPTCRHRKMLPRIIHILDIPGAFYRYGDDRFLGVFDGKLRPLTEAEEFAIMHREAHPLSAEVDGEAVESSSEEAVADHLPAGFVETPIASPQLAENPNELLPSDRPKVNRRGF